MPDLTVADVLQALERVAPGAKAAAWDAVGLQVGDPAALVQRAAVCHEVTEDVAEWVEAHPVDLLIAYHPLLFRPTTRLVAGTGPSGRAFRLARAGTAVAVAHTNFDVAAFGAADALAETLELGDAVPFAPVWGTESVKVVTFVPAADADRVAAAMAGAGAGTIGRYEGCSFRLDGTGTFFAPGDASPAAGRAGAFNTEPEVRIEMTAPAARRDRVVAALVAAHPYEEPAFDIYERRGDAGFVGRAGAPPPGTTLRTLAAMVAERLGGVVRWAGDPERPIARAAVAPGSGGDLIEAAASAGADALVTGDVSHHRARLALDLGLSVVDPGHAATERPGMSRLYAAVSQIVPEVEDLGKLDPDPWRSV